jgi:hypothetical protein
MSYDGVRRTLEQKLADEWTATPIRWPDAPFNPSVTLAYIAPHLLFGDSSQASMNLDASAQRLYRTMPVLMIQVFTPELEGAGPALRFADTLCDMFRSLTLVIESGNTLVFYDPAVTRVGVSDGWLQYNVAVSFRWDRVLTPAA